MPGKVKRMKAVQMLALLLMVMAAINLGIQDLLGIDLIRHVIHEHLFEFLGYSTDSPLYLLVGAAGCYGLTMLGRPLHPRKKPQLPSRECPGC